MTGAAAPLPAPPGAPPTLSALMLGFLEHAQVYYRGRSGKPGREYGLIREVLHELYHHPVNILPCEFTPKRLRESRERLIANGWSRKHINKPDYAN